MTPTAYFNAFGRKEWNSASFYITAYGYVDDNYPNLVFGLRPVINLKANLKFSGDGTKNNPYIPSL